MRLYVTKNNKKIYIAANAIDRYHLQIKIGSPYFKIGENDFNVNDVQAIPDTHNANLGAVIAGIIGLIGGPFGLFICFGFGYLIGCEKDEKERKNAERFNNSKVIYQ